MIRLEGKVLSSRNDHARMKRLLMEGRSRKEIAATLSLSENTVATYLKTIYGHLGVNSHAALMHRFRHGDGGDR